MNHHLLINSVSSKIVLCLAWDYSVGWKPLCRTLALARQVNTLSTKVLSDHFVSSNGAFFRERRFSRHVLLLVLLSSACLASSSTALTVYVFFPNNHIRLASFCGPNSANSMVLTTFHNTPEQSFAFCYQRRIWTFADSCIMELLYHWAICEPTKMCCSSCSIPC